MKKFLKNLVKIIAIILLIVILVVLTILSFGTLAPATISLLYMVLTISIIGLIVCAIISPDGTKAAFRTVAKGVSIVAKGAGKLLSSAGKGLLKGLGLSGILLAAGLGTLIFLKVRNNSEASAQPELEGDRNSGLQTTPEFTEVENDRREVENVSQ